MVADRIRSLFGTLLRGFEPGEDDPVTDFVLVTHAVTIRAFQLAWFHRPWEWAERVADPRNASVLTIAGRPGSWAEAPLFRGFAHPANAQQLREPGHDLSPRQPAVHASYG